MIWLNTYWTFSYVLMLLFVFWLLLLVYEYLKPSFWTTNSWLSWKQLSYKVLFSALGTFFFHCWW